MQTPPIFTQLAVFPAAITMTGPFRLAESGFDGRSRQEYEDARAASSFTSEWLQRGGAADPPATSRAATGGRCNEARAPGPSAADLPASAPALLRSRRVRAERAEEIVMFWS